jgi:hypothetical protein
MPGSRKAAFIFQFLFFKKDNNSVPEKKEKFNFTSDFATFNFRPQSFYGQWSKEIKK